MKWEYYCKLPIVVEATQLREDNILQVLRFRGITLHSDGEKEFEKYKKLIREEGMAIFTPEGLMIANVGDYIIKGPNNELYPLSARTFSEIYEPIIRN